MGFPTESEKAQKAWDAAPQVWRDLKQAFKDVVDREQNRGLPIKYEDIRNGSFFVNIDHIAGSLPIVKSVVELVFDRDKSSITLHTNDRRKAITGPTRTPVYWIRLLDDGEEVGLFDSSKNEWSPKKIADDALGRFL